MHFTVTEKPHREDLIHVVNRKHYRSLNIQTWRVSSITILSSTLSQTLYCITYIPGDVIRGDKDISMPVFTIQMLLM